MNIDPKDIPNEVLVAWAFLYGGQPVGTATYQKIQGITDKYPQTFLEISDCHKKIRLHKTSDDSSQDFLNKMKLLKSEIELFINHLEANI